MTKLCPRGKAAAKRKFKVYPSAYANAYASKICAGKIKDPSGVKRKDFKGPKPAAKGRMIKAATGAALGAISAGAGAIGAAALRANKRKADKAKAEKRDIRKVEHMTGKNKNKFKDMRKKAVGGMTAGAQSALGRIQKANMVKARMGKGVDYQNYLKGLKKATTKPIKASKYMASKDEFLKRRKQLLGSRALQAAKATRIGKIAAGVAGAALLGKAALEKMYEKRTGKKPLTKRRKLVDKKRMGGLKSELNNPARGYTKGGIARGGGAAIKGTDFKGVF